MFTESSYAGAASSILVQSTEFDKGPQTTLWGRNAIGGALQINSRRPDRTQTEEIRGNYGSFGRWEAGARVSGPLAPTLRYSLTANYVDQKDGYFNNVAGGRDEGNTGTYLTTDGQLAMDFTSRLSAWAKLDFNTYDYSNRTTYSTAPWVTAKNTTAASSTTLNPFWMMQPANQTAVAGNVILTLLNNQDVTQNPVLTTGDNRNFLANTWGGQTLHDNWSGATQIKYDFDNSELKYIAGAQRYVYDGTSDFDGTNIDSYQVRATGNVTCNPLGTPVCFTGRPSIQHYGEDRSWYTHELDWTSKGDGPVQWLGGLFYYHNKFDNILHYPGTSANALDAYQHPKVFTPSFVLVDAAANPSGEAYFADGVTVSTSTAGFGEVDWDVLKKLKLKGALRYTHDEKDVVETGRALCLGGSLCSGFSPLLNMTTSGANTRSYDYTSAIVSQALDRGVNSVGFVNGVYTRTMSGSWNGLTGTAGLEYRPWDDTLVYAKYDRAYKAGALNNGSTGFGAPRPFVDPEYVNAYTAGFKSRPVGNLTLDAEAFWYDWLGRQTPVTFAANTPQNPGPNPLTTIVNLAKTRNVGGEISSRWTPITDWHISLGYAYQHNRVRVADPIVDTSSGSSLPKSIVGAQLPLSPENSMTLSTDYTFRPSFGPLTLTANYNWIEHSYAGLFNTDYYREPSYSNLNLSALWTEPGGRFTVLASVKNVLDEDQVESVTPGLRYVPGTLGAPQVANDPNPLAVTSKNIALAPPRIATIELRAKF